MPVVVPAAGPVAGLVVVYDTELDASGAAIPNLRIDATLVASQNSVGTGQHLNVTRVKGITDSTGRWQPYPIFPGSPTANAAGGLTLQAGQTFVVDIQGRPSYRITTPLTGGPYRSESIRVTQ